MSNRTPVEAIHNVLFPILYYLCEQWQGEWPPSATRQQGTVAGQNADRSIYFMTEEPTPKYDAESGKWIGNVVDRSSNHPPRLGLSHTTMLYPKAAADVILTSHTSGRLMHIIDEGIEEHYHGKWPEVDNCLYLAMDGNGRIYRYKMEVELNLTEGLWEALDSDESALCDSSVLFHKPSRLTHNTYCVDSPFELVSREAWEQWRTDVGRPVTGANSAAPPCPTAGPVTDQHEGNDAANW